MAFDRERLKQRLDTMYGASGETDLRQSLIEGMASDPDRAARALPLAEKNQIPLDMAERNLDTLEAEDKFDSIDYNTLMLKNPLLADFLRDRENARLAHDDVGALTQIGDFGRSIGSGFAGGVQYAMSGAGKGLQRMADHAAQGQVKMDQRGMNGPIDRLLGTTAIGTTALVGQGLDLAADGWEAVAEFIRPPDERRNLATDIGEGLGQVGMQIAAATLSAPATVPLMVAQGLGYGFQAAEDAGKYGTMEGDATALLYAGVTGLTEKYGLEFLMKGIPEPIKRGVIGAVARAAQKVGMKPDGAVADAVVKVADTTFRGVTEATQEWTEGFLQNLVDIGVLKVDKNALTGLPEAAAAGGGVGLIVGGLVNLMVRGKTSFEMEKEKIVAAEMKQARGVLSGSKLFARARHKVNEYLNAEMGNKDLYLNPTAVQTFYQSMPDDKKAMLNQSMPDFETRLAEAVSTEGDFVINRADYMTYIQPIDEQAVLDNYVRYEPDDLSIGDRSEYDDFVKTLMEGVDKQDKGMENPDLVQEFIYGQLVRKMGERGASSSPDIARLLSQNPRKFYEAVAAQTNYDPRAMDILNRLIRDVQINRVNPKVLGMAKRDDFDLLIDAARTRARQDRENAKRRQKTGTNNLFGERIKKKKPKLFEGPKPVTDYLISKGKIRNGSGAAKFLEPLGLTPKTYPALFSSEGRIKGLDNIPHEEMSLALGDITNPENDGNDYVDREWIIESIRDEMLGYGARSYEDKVAQNMEEELRNLAATVGYMGIDLSTASNQEIKDALARYEQEQRDALYGMPPEQDPFAELGEIGMEPAEDPSVIEVDGQDVKIDQRTLDKVEELEKPPEPFAPEEKPAPIEEQPTEPDPVPEPEPEPEPVAPAVPEKYAKIEKTYMRVQELVGQKETDPLAAADGLLGIIGNLDNKLSREAFTELTGTALPKTVKGTRDAVDAWAGLTEDDLRKREEKDTAKKRETAEKRLERDIASDGAKLSQIKVQGAGTLKEYLDDMIARGFNTLVPRKDGAATTYFLANKDGQGYSIKFKGAGGAPLRYIRAVLELTAMRQADMGKVKETDPAPEPKDHIADFGEKIGGARKDVWQGYSNKMTEVLPDDLKLITLSKHFPEPDYEGLIAQGVDVNVLATIKAMRDMIPAKPRQTFKLRDWARMVAAFRDHAAKLIDGSASPATVLEVARRGQGIRTYRNLEEKIVLYMELGYPAFTKAGDFEVNFGEYKLVDGIRYDKPVGKWSVNKGYRIVKTFDQRSEAVNWLRAQLAIKPDDTKTNRSVKLDIYQYTKTGEIVIGKIMGRGKQIDLKGGFKDRREAAQFLSDNQEALLVLFEKRKNTPPERRSINDPRKGEDYRRGDDVTPEKFAAEFGFRGVEFGNYVEQKRRAEDLNNAYDALLDLASLISVPSRAISLNGSLGLAFGARGRGGKNAAAAHFEPDFKVINLTKAAGKGSLAHEWWHALDDFFGKKQAGRTYLTADPTLRKVDKDGNPITDPAIRPEVVEAFKNVMSAIKKTDMVKRSKELDKTRTKDYWSTDIELSARAFEAYIIHKAAQKGESNDYLANIVGQQAWEGLTSADGGTAKEGTSSYPYPSDREMLDVIAPAFDALFATLQTKQTDKGVTFFQSETVNHLEDRLVNKYGIKLSLSSGRPVVIGKIEVPKEKRRQGIAKNVIKEITDWADKTGNIIALTPTDEFGTPKRILERFYERNGFVSNSGKNKDFSISETMYRSPRTLNQTDKGVTFFQSGQRNTESPAFKAWFGDSKVVDADGKPLVVYHGTTAKEQFAAFDLLKAGARTDTGNLGTGIYMTPQRFIARAYANNKDQNIMPLYASVKNPLELVYDENYIKNVIDLADKLGVAEKSKWSGTKQINAGFSEEFRKKALEAGYDGIIARATNNSKDIVEIVAYNPTQVKSVNNRGTFDSNDPRILFQTAFHGSPYRFDKFTLDHIGTGEGAQAYGWGLYFASRKEVAEFYREGLKGRNFHKGDRAHVHAGKSFKDSGYAINDALEGMKNAYPKASEGDLQSALNEAYFGEGQLYEVKIPEDDVLLHWDKPLSEQPQKVQEALSRLGNDVYDTGFRATMNELIADRGDIKGMEIYKSIGRYAKIDDESISKKLNEFGIKGIKYLDGTSRGAGDGSYNYVIFDDSAIETIRTFYQQGMGGRPRGAISFMPDGRAVINLFQDEDLSTVLHEFGHLYWKALTEIAALENPPASIVKDVRTVRAWAGANPDDLTVPLTVEQEEKIADGFLAYLREGKAPSVELQGAFSRFKRWMTRLYKGVRDTLPKITPEVRDVFDRMLATEEEINRLSSTPEFSIDMAIMNFLPKSEQERYRKKVEGMIEQAKERLLKKALAEAERKYTKEYREAEAESRRIATAQVNTEQVYQAIDQILKAGGLDKDWLTKTFGKEILKYMTAHGQGMVAKKGGMPPHMIAGATGYTDARLMISAIMNAPRKADRIAQAAQQTLDREYGDMLRDQTVGEEAMRAYHNGIREEVLAIETKVLADLAGIPAPTPDAIKAKAIQIMAETKVGEISAERRLRSEKSAYFKYGKALGQKQYAKAAKHKAQQLLNHHLYRMSLAADEKISKRLEQWRRLSRRTDEKAGKAIDIDYVYAARAILAKYGVVSDEGFNFKGWIDQLTRENPELAETLQVAISMHTEDVPGWKSRQNVRGITTRTPPFKQMGYADFRALADAVDNLIETGRNQRQLTIEGKKVAVQDAVDNLTSVLNTMQPSGISTGYGGKLSTKDLAAQKLFSAKAWGRRINHWVRSMDGGNYTGFFRTYFWNRIIDAVGAYKDRRRDEIKKVVELIQPFKDDLHASGPVAAPELVSSKTGETYVFEDMGEVIGMMLHTGNESNLYKLVAGMGWGDVDEDGNVDTEPLQSFLRRMEAEGRITRAHWELVQAMWDQLETLKPDVWKAHKEMYGFRPEEVTASPVHTSFGEFKGGYWPAIVDRTKSRDAEIRQAVSAVQSGHNQYAFPTTGRGATKSRVEAYVAPLEFSLRLLPSHVDWALRFIHIEPAIKDVMKIVMNKEFRASMDAINPAAIDEMIVPWLSRVGRQTTELPVGGGKTMRDVNRVAGYIRRQTGLQLMMGNVINILQQATGLAPLARKTGYRNFAREFSAYWRNPRLNAQRINGLSSVMRHQQTMFEEDYQRHLERILEKRNKFQKVQDFQDDYGYIGQRIFQHSINNIGWMAAYNQALAGDAKGVSADDVDAAIKYADEIVAETQGFNSAEYVSASEVTTQLGKLFLLFYSYFNNQGNMLVNEAQDIKRSDRSRGGKAAAALHLYLIAFAIPSFVADLIGATLRGALPDDDDEDGTALDEWFQFFAISQVRYLNAMVPYAREIGSFVIGKFTDLPYDDQIAGSPVFSVLQRALNAPFSVYNAVFADGDASKAMRDTMTAVGMTGVPVGFVQRPVTYAVDVAEGDSKVPDEPLPATLEVGRGLLAGPAVGGGNSGGK